MTRPLSEMTPEERQACVGMWCDNLISAADVPAPVVLACVQGEQCWVLHTNIHGERSCFPLDSVAPRLDMPRAWSSAGSPPALSGQKPGVDNASLECHTREAPQHRLTIKNRS